MAQLWEIVGGTENGGIIVREGCDLKSPQQAERLPTGACVEEVALVGERLHFRKCQNGGESLKGPSQGWISIALKGKLLARRMPRQSGENSSDREKGGVEQSSKQDQFNPYEILGVSPDATDAQIKSAYRKASLRIHPDHNPDPEAAEQFRNLTTAKNFLLNPLKRFMYNLSHGHQARRDYVKWWSDWQEVFDELDAEEEETQTEHRVSPSPSQSLGSEERRTDILVIGATGFVGTLICSLLQRRCPGRSWSIAARCKQKLDLLETRFGKDLAYRGQMCISSGTDVKRIVASARIVIDATGPKWDVQHLEVAAACVEAGTHYIDITGYPADCLAAKGIFDCVGPKAESAGVSLVYFSGIGAIVFDFAALALVQHIRLTHHKPTRRIDAYESSHGVFLSGGVILAAKGDGRYESLLKEYGYFFLGGEPREGLQKHDDEDNFMPILDEYSGMWKNLSEIPDNLVLRCSYGLSRKSGQSYGENFRFQSWMLHADEAAANMRSLRTANKFLRRGYDKHIAMGKIPGRGQGPCERLRKDAITTRILVAEAEEGTPGQGAKAHCAITLGPGGLGDHHEGTAFTSIEVASCMLDALDLSRHDSEAQGKLLGGFGTPTYHLSRFGFQDRLFSALGIQLKIFDGAPAPQIFQNAMSAAGVLANQS